MITGPVLPQPTPRALWYAQHFVATDRGGTVGFPHAPIPTDRDEGLGTARKDRIKATTCTTGPILGDALDIFSRRDLIEQQRAVALMARGECDRTDVPVAVSMASMRRISKRSGNEQDKPLIPWIKGPVIGFPAD